MQPRLSTDGCGDEAFPRWGGDTVGYSLFIQFAILNLLTTQITSANFIAFGGERDDGLNGVYGQSS